MAVTFSDEVGASGAPVLAATAGAAFSLKLRKPKEGEKSD